MPVETIIEKIKKIEEEGQKRLDDTEKEKEQIIKKAREKAILIVAEFEKTEDTTFRDALEKTRADVEREKEKILSDGGKEAEELRSSASKNLTESARFIFSEIKRNILQRQR